ncbi:MAG: hypothetical protein Tsb0020_07250 [Haliangiales bacterium]
MRIAIAKLLYDIESLESARERVATYSGPGWTMSRRQQQPCHQRAPNRADRVADSDPIEPAPYIITTRWALGLAGSLALGAASADSLLDSLLDSLPDSLLDSPADSLPNSPADSSGRPGASR